VAPTLSFFGNLSIVNSVSITLNSRRKNFQGLSIYSLAKRALIMLEV
jgi:hypothetical protein